MALFGYVYSKNKLEQKSFEELSYKDQYYIIANDEVAEPIVTTVSETVETVKNMGKAAAIIAVGLGIYFLKKK